jgi:ABC-type transport system involved in multi-copper enzyme maturation permease subunit
MIWFTWRQLRVQALAVWAAVAAIVVTAAVTGGRLADLAHANASVFDHLTRTDRSLYFAGIVVVAVAPAIIGAFWGAPLIAREIETGTHLLAWTQSVTRTRWLVVKLAMTTGVAAAAVGAISWAVTWWSHPLDGAMSSTHGSLPSRLTPVSFAMRGIAPVGYAIFAVVLGVTLGAILRRSLPAMALTLAVFAFVQIATPIWIRPHLVSPVRETVTLDRDTLDGITSNDAGGSITVTAHTSNHNDWILSNQTVDSSGRAVALPSWFADCIPKPPSPGSSASRGEAPNIDDCLARLADEGYRQRIVYQPADRFWELQWRETAMFMGLSALIAGVGFWWTRRRLT